MLFLRKIKVCFAQVDVKDEVDIDHHFILIDLKLTIDYV